MRKKYLRFEQMDVFRPMPVSVDLKEQIRQEADRAKAMAKTVFKPKVSRSSS